ncbi:hypothetical protein CAPTEDRAFT_222812 [Capitella teleta]|uniref:Uncharacterized protein n=1 Tax=Capitella teleta TaxID=283909 RepID=R7TR96_CAPTE|nr:hypothetical protein CAPTEDRAFT_222812 [Capitella teleta]|eukprot:ELT94016.1 hypothetical protein CAPTEDRAFT_222812 [Capitella teleta]
MSRQDLSGDALRGSNGRFRMATDRRFDLCVQQEIEDVDKKAIIGIIASKEAQERAPLPEPARTMRTLAPEFEPKKNTEKRKSQPVFHSEPKAHRCKPPAAPLPPAYNPLDREISMQMAENKTNKFPFNKTSFTTTQGSNSIPTKISKLFQSVTKEKPEDMNVMLEGKPALPYDDPIIGPIESANIAEHPEPSTPVAPVDWAEMLPPKPPQFKPAIVGSVGTTTKAPMATRPAPVPKAKSRYNGVSRRVQSARSINSEESFVSVNIILSDKNGDEDSNSRASSTHTVRSVKDLVEEAKLIASPHPRKTSVASKDRTKSKSSVSKSSKSSRSEVKSKNSSITKEIPPQRAERTVDEIIASLKEPTQAKVVSEADRKIQAIMEKVMLRSKAVLGDLDTGVLQLEVPGEEEQTGEEIKNETEQEAKKDEASETEEEEEEIVEVKPLELTEEEKEAIAVEAERLRKEREEEEEWMRKLQQEADLKQAWHDLQLPSTVTREDILSLQGVQREIETKPMREGSRDRLLGSWQPAKVEGSKGQGHWRTNKSIHHFCKESNAVQLPDHYKGVWRRYHVPSKHNILEMDIPEDGNESAVMASPRGPGSSRLNSRPVSMNSEELLRRQQSAAATRILSEAKESEQTMEDWQQKAEQVVREKSPVRIFTRLEFQLDLGVEGEGISLQRDESFVYWNPAPPKWQVPPSVVKEQLFPAYHGTVDATEDNRMGTLEGNENEDLEEEVQEEDDSEEIEDKIALERTLNRQYGSAKDLTNFRREMIAREKVQDAEEDFNDLEDAEKLAASSPSVSRALTQLDLLLGQNDSKLPSSRGSESESPTKVPFIAPIERPGSAPPRIDDDSEDFLLVYQDFDAIMKEIAGQKKIARDAKKGKREEVVEDPIEVEVEVTPEMKTEGAVSIESRMTSLLSPGKKKADEPTPAELALQAGRNYVLLPKKKLPKPPSKKSIANVDSVVKMLTEPPRKLERSASMPRITAPIDRELRVPLRVRSKRRQSVYSKIDFEHFKRVKRFKDMEDEREWVRGIWDSWFHQIYPPTPEPSEWSVTEEEETVTEETVVMETQPKRKASHASSVLSESLQVEPVIDDEEDLENIDYLNGEVERLNTIISSSDNPRPYDLCRRGAILRKLGCIKEALHDLNRAIEQESQMLDAYWHRHMIYLLLNKRQNALEDLNLILRHNRNHAAAYRSRAHIFREMNDVTLAIVNFSQAIKINPNDDEAYYQRAQMYEQRGEQLLAMEDFSMVTKINPSKTVALFKHGLHYFNNGNWSSAIEDFTNLLKQKPNDSRALLYRGRAHANLQNWNEAAADLSGTIHLDPSNAKAFYFRACLLRKLHPKKALQDLSVSLMLDDGDSNILAFLHRGILYNEICKHEDAIPDFEAVLKLDKDCACAHVNLGLIFMQKMNNYHRAVKKFSAAIKSDPTYVKAYICRAEAYQKVHDIKNALLDITRAIHLRPDMQHLYMYRGQLVHKIGDLDLAAFCVKHASELNSGLGQSPTQQAIVHSFLKNYDKAIGALVSATKVKPVPPLFLLLGKTQMKAQLWEDAIVSFQKALDLVEDELRLTHYMQKPWQEKLPWPPEAAEMNFLLGMCQMETRDYLNANEAFNNAIRVNPKYAEVPTVICKSWILELLTSSQAYYRRGMTRMKLKQARGVQDFNRALALDPSLFQAYLSRAAFYGLRKQYSKAILNCNQAIKLQPKSIRAYLYRGALKFHIKAYTLAVRDLTQAISIDTRCLLAYFNRAVCYHYSKHSEKALKDYGIVLLLGDQLKLKVLINRGLLYSDLNDYTNALHDFLLAVQLCPEDKQIHHTLGLCYHKLDQLEDAVNSFTRALELDPFFLEALICRGNVFMDFGHTFGLTFARHDYERVLRVDPVCLPARVNLAYNLQVQGKFQQAWHQFNATITLNPRYQPALEGRAIINLQMSNMFAAFQDIYASSSN